MLDEAWVREQQRGARLALAIAFVMGLCVGIGLGAWLLLVLQETFGVWL